MCFAGLLKTVPLVLEDSQLEEMDEEDWGEPDNPGLPGKGRHNTGR